MQDDEGPLPGLEPEESPFELVAVGDRRLGAGDRVVIDVEERDVDPVPPDPARLIDAGTCTASFAPSASRRMSQAAESRREIAAAASVAKAS